MYAIYGNMDPINIPQVLAYIPYMGPMGCQTYIETPRVKRIPNGQVKYAQILGVVKEPSTWASPD